MGSGIDRYHDGEYELPTKPIKVKDKPSVYEEMDMEDNKAAYDGVSHKGAFYNTTMDIKDEETTFPKQERYQNTDGKIDHIDACAAEFTPEEFRGAMKFTISKYGKRLGKKDSIAQEVTKIADYANRWLQYEIELESKEK